MANSKSLRSSTSLANDSKLDYISKLPDELLVYILDKLTLQEAMGTSFLSKRWKGLWRYKRKVELDYRRVQKTSRKGTFAAFKIFRALREQSMQCINISLRYNLSMSTDVQSLIAYTSLKKVEELHIDFNKKKDNETRLRRRYPFIVIPECELHHSSVVKLSLMSLQLDSLPRRSFKALRELFFSQVKLSVDSVENITSNCPSLTFLSLTNCNPYSDLKVIVAKNSNLLHLVIKEELTEVLSTSKLCIKARVLKSIEFGSALPRKSYEIEAALVCSEATFILDQMHHSRQAMRVTSVGIQGKIVKNFWSLLNKLRTAKRLTLSSWCIQVLAVEVVMMQGPLNFEVEHLTLKTRLDIWGFRGVAYMLLGSCKLEHLVIIIGVAEKEKLNFTNIECMTYYGSPISFGKILQNLANVEFRNYKGIYQTWEDGKYREDYFFTKCGYGSLLVWNLKTFASNLQKMKFITAKQRFETDEFGNLGKSTSVNQRDSYRLLDLYKNIQKKNQHRLLEFKHTTMLC